MPTLSAHHHRHRLHLIRHKNTLFLIISLAFAIVISHEPWFISMLHSLGGLGYIGAFIAGMLFVSTFTVPLSVVIFSVLNSHLSLVEISLAAGLGAMLGDAIMLRLVRDDLTEEFKPVEKYVEGTHLWKLLHTRHFRWTLPVIGAILIVTPLPNELGFSLLRLAKMSALKFTTVSFVLNLAGIVSIATATRFFT